MKSIDHGRISCAILLPLTSKRLEKFDDVEINLKKFYETCINNAGADVSLIIYLGIDCGDRLLDKVDKPAEAYLKSLGCIHEIRTKLFKPENPAAICKIWIELARCAYEDERSDYFVLLGDDVTIECSDWVEKVGKAFEDIHTQLPDTPLGFGCVALLDTGAPGFPTFPVISRVHMKIFEGDVIPRDHFVNQDGDPFLFHLYIPFGATRFAEEVRLINEVGGYQHTDKPYDEPRYDRVHVSWKELLDHGIRTINEHTPSPTGAATVSHKPLKVLVDVVIPSFRVERALLEGILAINVPENCITKFIIVIDDPDLNIDWLQELQRKEFNKILLLRNTKNMGASHSRNVGIKESSADWILFIDDDVKPSPDILIKYLEAIKEHGTEYDAFVGPTFLPEDHRNFSTAVLLSGVAFFWTLASTSDTMPWGITANLLVRNFTKINKPLLFDCRFIKTGGGEDIDYCLKLFERTTKKKALKCVPAAKADHPWWSKGNRDYRHFYNWAVGDSYLIYKHPEHSFLTPPNIVEFMFLMTFCSVLHSLRYWTLTTTGTLWTLIPLIFIVDTAFESIPILSGEEEKKLSLLKKTCGRDYYLYPLILADMNFIRICSEVGHFLGPLSHGQFRICYRFDWFCGMHSTYRSQCMTRDTLRLFAFSMLSYFVWARWWNLDLDHSMHDTL